MTSSNNSSRCCCCCSRFSSSSSRRQLSTRCGASRGERERESEKRASERGKRKTKREKKMKLESLSPLHISPPLSHLFDPLPSDKMKLSARCSRPLLHASPPVHRTTPARHSPRVVRAMTASPKRVHAAQSASSSKGIDASNPLTTTATSPLLQSSSAVQQQQLPFTTSLFVRALPGRRVHTFSFDLGIERDKIMRV